MEDQAAAAAAAEGMGSKMSDDSYYKKLDPSMKQSIFCYRAMMPTSGGVWFGDNPLEFSFPILLYQLILVFIATRATHAVLRHLSQPQVISQIVAGIILGPTFIGRSMAFEKLLYSMNSWEHLNTLSMISYMFFLFMVGVKTDMHMIRKTGRKAAALAVFSTVPAFALVVVVGYTYRNYSPPPHRNGKLVVLFDFQWSLTSYVVLTCTLSELNLLTSKLGRLAMSASLIGDFLNISLGVLFVAHAFASEERSVMTAVKLVSAFVAVVVSILFVARPLIMWLIRRTPDRNLLDEGSFVAVLFIALGCGIITEYVGLHVTMGPFLLGLVLPGGAPLGVTLVEKLERLVVGVFLPVYVLQAGLRMDLPSLLHVQEWGYAGLLVAASVVGKFVGSMLVCIYCRMPPRDAFSLSLMMLQKGIREVDAAAFWMDAKLISRASFTAMILAIIVFGGGTAPLIKLLYRPEDRFVSYKRRTVQHTKPSGELRVVACVYHQENVNSIISLLESSHPSPHSPICVYVLHLIQLAGRSASVLAQYKRSRSSNVITSTDHIVNAFNYFAQQSPGGAVTVIPYTCLAPYSTMHDDICSLALDKKASLVLAPFHKHLAIDGTMDTTNPSIQLVNINVLSFSPCSVSILVFHGVLSGNSLSSPAASGGLRRVAVYFFGGPDDREALAYGARMAEDRAVGLTLVRFRLPKEMRGDGGREGALDDAMVDEFRERRVDGARVVYKEEIVLDGEGTVGVIRAMSSGFCLLIVGRREGKESTLTDGLSTWNEFPELGVVGDLLASTDFGGRVSTMVVQQQVRYGGGDSPRVANKGQVMPAEVFDD